MILLNNQDCQLCTHNLHLRCLTNFSNIDHIYQFCCISHISCKHFQLNINSNNYHKYILLPFNHNNSNFMIRVNQYKQLPYNNHHLSTNRIYHQILTQSNTIIYQIIVFLMRNKVHTMEKRSSNMHRYCRNNFNLNHLFNFNRMLLSRHQIGSNLLENECTIFICKCTLIQSIYNYQVNQFR